MSAFEQDRLRLRTSRQLHLTPWDLIVLLKLAGIADETACGGDVEIVERTEVNGGRTVVIKWDEQERRLAMPTTRPADST